MPVLILLQVTIVGLLTLYGMSKILKQGRCILSELDDVNAAVTNLGTQATASNTALSTIAAELLALEGTVLAPGVLEGIATRINAVSTGLASSAAAANAATTPPTTPPPAST